MRNVIGLVTVLVGLSLAGATGVDAAERPNQNGQAAAKRGKQRAAKGSISGTVVHGRGNKAVAGAKVHVVHQHRHQHHAATAATQANGKAKGAAAARNNKAAGKQHHHGVTTGAGGAFTLKAVKAGSHVVAAHKRHVGTGHARVTVAQGQTANVTVRIHKHHQHHAAAGAQPSKA